jgi:hypothetical protein
MRIGGSNQLREIGRRNWEKLASELRFTDAALINRLMEFATVCPITSQTPLGSCTLDTCITILIGRLAEQLISRAEDC